MSNEESRLLLYVLCANDGRTGELHHVYARNEIEARAALNAWIAEQAMLGRKNIEVKHWPGGFMAGHRTYWTGCISVQSGESEAGHA